MNRVCLCLCQSVCVFGFICSAGAQAPGQGTGRITEKDTQAGVPVLLVPRVMRFSGVLKDHTGKAKTGVAGVTFAIYAEQDGGAPLWMETQNVTLEEGGKYTVLLGANSNGGVPMELFNGSGEWRVASGERGGQEKDNAEAQSTPRNAEQEGNPTGTRAVQRQDGGVNPPLQGERWLGVEGPDIREMPRVLLVSVPYALRAADAETLGGLPASAFVLAQGSGEQGGAGTGGSASTTNRSTQAGMPVPLKPKSAATTSTTATDADDVAKFDPLGNLIPSAIFEANGNVGIGTTNPLAALHVNGNTVLVNSGTTAQVRVNGSASSGRFGQDANGTFLANDTSGSPLRFLTSNSSNLNEWMRIGSTGSVNIGSAQAAQNGEVVFAPDNVDRVHSVIGQAGSQYHFRLSRATPDVRGARDFLITPYTFGTAIEYAGVMEFWTQEFSVHAHPSRPGLGAYFWVGDEIDSGGLVITARDNGGGANSYVILAADRFDHTSHGSMNFVVRDPVDTFRFAVGAVGSEVVKGRVSGTATGSSLDLYSGTVQATLRAQSGSTSGGGGVQLGSSSNSALSLFTNNGAAQVTLFPSGNFSIGNTTDAAPLTVGTAAQFQVSAAGATTIGGGTAITRHLSVSAAMAFAEFAGGSCNTLSIPVAGAGDGDSVALGIPNALGSIGGLAWFGWVSAAGTVSVRGCNVTNQTLPTPPAANVRVDVWQH